MRTIVDHERFIYELVAWLERRLAPPGMTITPTTVLFEGRLIDSVRILELIAWVERATDRQIPDSRIVMDNFRTAERIADVFLEEAGNVAD
jgi:acyl carrier protein